MPLVEWGGNTEKKRKASFIYHVLTDFFLYKLTVQLFSPIAHVHEFILLVSSSIVTCDMKFLSEKIFPLSVYFTLLQELLHFQVSPLILYLLQTHELY